ncbi:MAG: D-Ala-D-Ala carboxypeptidase family metallohydrolase [Pseudomonas sp.]|nr:D-Ala-D-Ala carboxypeptidase family metallohydrolase [Pseudomonas sp.]
MKLIAPLLLIVSLAAHADDRDQAAFAHWSASHGTEAFQQFLQSRKIASVVPLYQLLRSATDWRRCNAAPFAVPPADHWPAVESTLRLVATLKEHGMLSRFEVVSAYRDAALNRCANGSQHSAHLQAFAVDLEFPEGSADAGHLCEFWKQQGGQWQMGLSRYPSGRVHIDTAGYRTWGEDYSAKTSYCR